MKLRIIYFFFLLFFTFVLSLSYKDGPAGRDGDDRTGSPFSDAPCQSCHTAGAFSPSLSVEILDGSTAIAAYEPGRSYTLKATITADAAAQVFGFQTVILKESDDTNAGSFGEAPEGMSVVELQGRQYAEHNTPSDENIFVIEWTAPASGTGEVNIYAACVAANNNVLNTGDGSVFLVDPLTLTELVTDADDINPVFAAVQVLNNPVYNDLNLKIWAEKKANYQLNIANISGQIIYSQKLELLANENLETIDLSTLPSGTYVIQISDGKAVVARKMVKM